VASSGTSTSVTSANWVDTLISDMRLFHDAPVAMLERSGGWASGAEWPAATQKPSNFSYAQAWTHVFDDTSHPNGNSKPWRVPGPYTGNQAPNTRVQQRDLQMWWLLNDGSWKLGTHSAKPSGLMYTLNWGQNSAAYDVLRDESANGGGVSIRGVGRENYENWLWHTWAAAHAVPSNYVGAVTVFYARLILDDPKGPDDRDNAHLLAAGAGDWYKDAATGSGNNQISGETVTYMGYSRFKYVTKEWQLFGWTSLSEAQIRANPPPIIGLPK